MFPDNPFQQLAQAIGQPPVAPPVAAPPPGPKKKPSPEQALEATLGPAYGEPIAIPNLPPANPGGFPDAGPSSGFGAGNPGAFLPPSGSSPPGLGMGATLARQMMERPTAQDKQEEMRQVMMRMPRGAQATPMPGMLGLAGMNQFTPESDADYHARGLKAFDSLDRMAGGAEKLALEKYLGVGALGNDTTRTGVQQGQLEIGQRGQAEKEREGEHVRNRATEKMKLYQAAILAGKTPEEATAVAQGMDVLGAQPGFQPGGFQVDVNNPTAGNVRVPPGKGVRVTPGKDVRVTPGAGPRVEADKQIPDATLSPQARDIMRHTNNLGSAAVSVGRKLKDAGKSLPEVAVALQSAMKEGEFMQKLPQVKEYLQHLYNSPREWDQFVDPSKTWSSLRELGNFFTRPSAEEILMNEIRKQLGLGPAQNFLTGTNKSARPLYPNLQTP